MTCHLVKPVSTRGRMGQVFRVPTMLGVCVCAGVCVCERVCDLLCDSVPKLMCGSRASDGISPAFCVPRCIWIHIHCLTARRPCLDTMSQSPAKSVGVSVLGRFAGVFHWLTSQMGVAVSQSKQGLQDGAPVAEGGCDSVVEVHCQWQNYSPELLAAVCLSQ